MICIRGNWTWAENCPNIGKVRVKHRGVLLTLKGTVIRSGAIKMIEGEKEYECRKCKNRWMLFSLLCFCSYGLLITSNTYKTISSRCLLIMLCICFMRWYCNHIKRIESKQN